MSVALSIQQWMTIREVAEVGLVLGIILVATGAGMFLRDRLKQRRQVVAGKHAGVCDGCGHPYVRHDQHGCTVISPSRGSYLGKFCTCRVWSGKI